MPKESELDFEWDEDKAIINLGKHKGGFGEAKTAFDDPLAITIEDPDHSEEERFIDIGVSAKGKVLVVVYTERKPKLRIIAKQPVWSEECMKKANEKNDEMRAEYDFSGGVRGKHYKRYHQGHTVTINKSDGSVVVQKFERKDFTVKLESDVREYFFLTMKR